MALSRESDKLCSAALDLIRSLLMTHGLFVDLVETYYRIVQVLLAPVLDLPYINGIFRAGLHLWAPSIILVMTWEGFSLCFSRLFHGTRD